SFVLDVFGDADYLAISVVALVTRDGEPLAKRVVVREDAPGELLADHDHSRRARLVLLSEITPFDERDTCGLEVARRHDAVIRLGLVLHRLPFETEAGSPWAAQRRHDSQARGTDAGRGAEVLNELLVKRSPLLFGIPAPPNVNRHHENLVSI